MPLITSSDYDFIRWEIDGQLNESSLPQSRIETRLAVAERWVTDRVDLVGLNATQLERAKLAALYYCASLIAPTVNIPTSDAGIAGASYTRKVMEPGANAARLLALAEKELDAATPEVEVSIRVGRGGSAQTVARW
jgi:hypothetical protein